jgi:prevent-host-death family protein
MSDVAIVPITELRQNLAAYLARVKAGETLRIVVHGEVVARLEPERSAREAARARLAQIARHMRLGDVVTPIAARWSAMHDDWAMNPPAAKVRRTRRKPR